MTSSPNSHRHVLSGGIRVFLADSLLIPTGLLVAAYLARRLGPDGYGVFVVAVALISWIEWSLTALFSRASVRFVAEAADWRPVGATIVTFHLVLATAAALLLVAVANPIAALLGTPVLDGRLRLFAADIPLFCLAQAHRNILIGLGDFQHRALAAAARWVSRLLLVLLFVELGWSIDGAILGSIGASAIELALCRVYVQPAFSARATLQIQRLWGYAVPLLLSALALRLFDKLDLVALTALGGTQEDAGFYGAAQNLSLLPSLVATSFSPLLLSSLTRAYRDSEGPQAERIARDAMRWAFLLVPFVGLAAGSAAEIVRLVFGPAFGPSASVLVVLLFAAVALLLISVMTAILVAAGRPGITLAFTGPLPLVAGLGYLALIPRAGARGAALVTFGAAALAALALAVVVHRGYRALPHWATVARAALVCAGAYAAAALWPAWGGLVLLKLATIGTGIVVAFLITGEFTPSEITAVRSWWRQRGAG
jgi:O-antigen/teichoic acid export membrane protein